MRASKTLISGAAAAAILGVIGLVYAESFDPDGSAPGCAEPATSPAPSPSPAAAPTDL